MIKSISGLLEKLSQTNEGKLVGGFGSIKGGINFSEALANSDTCNNTKTCGGTNDGASCVNSGYCGGATNSATTCSNSSSCFS